MPNPDPQDKQESDELLFVCKDGWAHHFVDNSKKYGNQSCSKCQGWANELVEAYAERLAAERTAERTIEARLDELRMIPVIETKGVGYETIVTHRMERMRHLYDELDRINALKANLKKEAAS